MQKKIIKKFLKNSVQYGHYFKDWNPKMAPYLLSVRFGHHIFDLVKTSKLLNFARALLEKKINKLSNFLFVGTDKFSSSLITKYGKKYNSFYINYRWLPGMLTNWITLQKQIDLLNFLEKEEQIEASKFLSKKDYSLRKKKIKKLNQLFCGIKNMNFLPEIVIFASNQNNNSLGIRECSYLGIPTISIVDSDCNPNLVPYSIPANDDSSESINFILHNLIDKIFEK